MAAIRFEWDRAKSGLNKRKHGISFEEAETVFSDDHALLLDDPEHSDEEERFILLGLSALLRAFATAIVRRMRSFASFQHARRIVQSETITTNGGENEKALRFFQSEAEPIR